jgi:hypothetical protein
MENTKILRTARRAGSKALVPGLVLYALLVVSACHRDTPEAALRTQLRDMQSAVGEGRMGDFMEGVAKDFTGNAGMDRAALHNLLRLQALGKSNMSATSGPLRIRIHDDQANVHFDVVLTGGRGRFLPDSVRTYSIASGWRIEGGKWRVHYAQWESMR